MSKILEGKLNCPHGSTLAYRRLLANKEDNHKSPKPGIVFLGGYMSDMMGTKASFLETFCEQQGLAFIRFDYYAHGTSLGELKDATIGRWKEDVLAILDNLTEGPQILIGSSMGGWLMLLAALARKDRIQALIGIAPAVDFIDHLLNLNSKQMADLEQEGVCYIQHKTSDTKFPLSKAFIEDARLHHILPLSAELSAGHSSVILLESESDNGFSTTNRHIDNRHVEISCPIRILHGMEDNEVPWQHSIKLLETLSHNDVTLTLIKNGDHRLSRSEDLQILSQILKNCISP